MDVGNGGGAAGIVKWIKQFENDAEVAWTVEYDGDGAEARSDQV